MTAVITDTVIEDVIADVFTDLALIDGTGSYFLDVDGRVLRYEQRPLEPGAPARPYICLGLTRIMPPQGLEAQPNNWENWDIEFDLYLYVDVDKTAPGESHRKLMLGLSDVNMALKVDEQRNEMAGNTWVTGAEADVVTPADTKLLTVGSLRIGVRVQGIKSKRGDMTQFS